MNETEKTLSNKRIKELFAEMDKTAELLGKGFGELTFKKQPIDLSAKVFPKGEYIICDPCYIFENSWTNLLNQLYDDMGFKTITNIFEFNSIKGFCQDTFIGDGTYLDKSGNKYDVDSGMLGIMPIEMLKIDNVYTQETLPSKYHVFTFDNEFEIYCDEGIFYFGDIVINTR